MSSLEIDTTVLRRIADDLRGIADAVPKTQAMDLNNSGSARVAAAAESLSMWAVVSGFRLAAEIDRLASAADMAALAFENQDEAVATEAKGADTWPRSGTASTSEPAMFRAWTRARTRCMTRSSRFRR